MFKGCVMVFVVNRTCYLVFTYLNVYDFLYNVVKCR